ncbi:unnamed protein product [Paramecium sonneborni]|uniref:Uncharacterized protein n=1 Tax=Paramecium sonneborni TaxID=65129 RepID=A0A8S1RSA3_9CILI|nr:unnamed protein product [Paramecium sonneborni]
MINYKVLPRMCLDPPYNSKEIEFVYQKYQKSFCQDHSFDQITFICLAPHQCQRKLCPICLEDHGYDKKYQLHINKFPDLIKQNLNELNFAQDKSQEQKQIQSRFESLKIKIENNIKNF